MANSYLDLNLKLYDVFDELFKINKHTRWEDVAKEITLEKISITYKEYGNIFPYFLDRYELLPKNNPSEKLSAIFQGSLDGLTIINNIARYSCYTDQIITFHPLQNPENTNPKMSPIEKPGLWQRDFINSLYFYIVLRKWVKSGIVHIIQSPFDYDKEARDYFWDLAKKRVDEKEELYRTPEVMKEHDDYFYQQFKKTLLGLPKEALKKQISNTYPDWKDEQVAKFVEELKVYEKKQPLHVDLKYDFKEGILNLRKGGGNLEQIQALCDLTGSHSYTTQLFVKRQLELRGTNPFWTKFSTLHSGTNLTYLDKVDVAFALKLREEDRLSDVRKALREISGFLDSTELDKVRDDQILAMNDKFKYEVEKSENEWQKILDDAQKNNWLAITGTSVISLLLDPTKIIVPAIGIPSSIAINEFFKKRKLRRYRNSDPYSVYVDLKNQQPDFFSDLKNCIF